MGRPYPDEVLGRTFDRRLAWFAVGLATVIFAVVAARNDATPPEAARNDPAATRQMLKLMRAGERVDSIVDYAFTRTVPGVPGEYRATITEVKWGDARISRASDTLLIDLPGRAYDCERVEDTAECATKPPDTSLPQSQVFALATALGVYNVLPLPSRTIAGQPARCFAVKADEPGRILPGLGHQTDVCLAPDGVVLSTRRVADNATESRDAQRVLRHVDRNTLSGVFSGFDAAFALLRR